MFDWRHINKVAAGQSNMRRGAGTFFGDRFFGDLDKNFLAFFEKVRDRRLLRPTPAIVAVTSAVTTRRPITGLPVTTWPVTGLAVTILAVIGRTIFAWAVTVWPVTNWTFATRTIVTASAATTPTITATGTIIGGPPPLSLRFFGPVNLPLRPRRFAPGAPPVALPVA